MTNFVDDNTSLDFPKQTLRGAPPRSISKYIRAEDWNRLCQAAYDLRTAVQALQDAVGSGNTGAAVETYKSANDVSFSGGTTVIDETLTFGVDEPVTLIVNANALYESTDDPAAEVVFSILLEQDLGSKSVITLSRSQASPELSGGDMFGSAALTCTGSFTGDGTPHRYTVTVYATTYSVASVENLTLSNAAMTVIHGTGEGGGEEPGGSSIDIINVKTDFDATGDGVADDTAEIQAAIAEGISTGKPVYFPAGSYLLSSAITATAPNGLTVMGDRAIIIFNSEGNYAFNVAATSTNVSFENLTFQTTSVSDDWHVNTNQAIFFGAVEDTKITRCTFERCAPAAFASDGNATEGRFLFAWNKAHNSPHAVNAPANAQIVNNVFWCDEYIDTRAQAIYIFGGAGNSNIEGNLFHRIAGQDIQLRASTARYQQRYTYSVVNNMFIESGFYSIWFGSDDHPDAANYLIANNIFRNCNGAVHGQGIKSATIEGNQVHYDWEYPGVIGLVEEEEPPVFHRPGGGISVSTGLTSGMRSIAGHVNIVGNTVGTRHPYVGTVTFADVPGEGDTITVGDTTYTWTALPSGPGYIGIAAFAEDCAANLEAALNGGDGQNVQNTVLRDMADVRTNEFATLDAPINVVMIASPNDFTLESTGTAQTCSEIRDMRAQAGIQVETTIGVSVSSNIIDYCAIGLSIARNRDPYVHGNRLSGCQIIGFMNTFSIYASNMFEFDSGVSQTYRLLMCSDGFPVLRDNGLIQEQEYLSKDMNGVSGTVVVGDGCQRMPFWFGESQWSGEAEQLQFGWANGDTVHLECAGLTSFDATFSLFPGAGEFSTAAELMALINDTTDWVCEYAPFWDVGETPQPPGLLIRTALPTDTQAAVSVNSKSKITGQVLKKISVAESFGRSLGGDSGAILGPPNTNVTKTAIFTQLANSTLVPIVQGVDAASHALDPVCYRSDCIPGIGYIITHAPSVTGAESFHWFLRST